MANYRRLISYIYAYEGEIKGKNIGFAKLESRNGQCRLSVNVKKVYMGSNDLGVYLLSPGQEIFLGNIFIRSGAGEYRTSISVENAAGSGCSMDSCYGLSIHEKGESWRCYTTIWEDAVAQAAQLELAEVTSEHYGDAEEKLSRKVEELEKEMKEAEQMTVSEAAPAAVPEVPLQPELEPAPEVPMQPEFEPAPEVPLRPEPAPEVPMRPEPVPEVPMRPEFEPAPEMPSRPEPAPEMPSRPEPAPEMPSRPEPAPEVPMRLEPAPEMPMRSESEPVSGQPSRPEPAPALGPQPQPEFVPTPAPERPSRPQLMPTPEQPPRPAPAPAPQPEFMPTPAPERPSRPQLMPAPEQPPRPAPAPQPQAEQTPATAPRAEQTPATPLQTTPTITSAPEPEEIILGNPQDLERLDQEERRSQPQDLWDGFRRRYPKIQAFDSVNGVEILTVKPQDIGLLPRENWNFGNNSFLLHGYYNYRYLIFARIGNGTPGRSRYILGVPGHYYSNEKYMASMFGFPHFVLSKKQPSEDGRFGYWYADIKMENQE